MTDFLAALLAKFAAALVEILLLRLGRALFAASTARAAA